MTASVGIWLAVAATLIVLILVRILEENRNVKKVSMGGVNHHHPKFIEIGKESEEFFIPGDPVPFSKESDYPYDNYIKT